jgi:hypothetical protein
MTPSLTVIVKIGSTEYRHDLPTADLDTYLDDFEKDLMNIRAKLVLSDIEPPSLEDMAKNTIRCTRGKRAEKRIAQAATWLALHQTENPISKESLEGRQFSGDMIIESRRTSLFVETDSDGDRWDYGLGGTFCVWRPNPTFTLHKTGSSIH